MSRSTTTPSAVLAAIVAEPGERTPELLAKELDLEVSDVRKEVRRLRRAGLAELGQCRIVPHYSGTGLAQLGMAESKMARRVWEALVDGDGSDAGHSRPKARRELAAAVGVPEDAGQFQRALKELSGFGSLSLPKDVWPTQKGIALLKAQGVSHAG